MTSTARLQREADAARVELADTLGQLRDGLAPYALSSEAIALAKDSGLTLARTLADQARTNPVPALLIGAGLTMLLTRTTGGDIMGVARTTMRKAASAGSEAASAAAAAATRTATDAATKAASTVSEAASRAAAYAADTARATADRTQQQVSEGYATMKDSLDTRLDEGQRSVKGLQDGLRDTLGETADSASRLAGAAQEKAASLAHQARHSFSQLLEEQPILMAAIGAAVGAAIGAALPLSRTEKDMIGTAGARAVGMGREAMATAADALKEEVAKGQGDGQSPSQGQRADIGGRRPFGDDAA